MNRRWTAAEDDELRARYPHEAGAVIAASMGRPLGSLFVRAHKLGLSGKKPRHFGPTHRRPPNAAEVGEVRVNVRGLSFIKVSDSRWRPLHHVRWEDANGPIPPGHVVAFKDGNPANVDPSNLELVSKREWIKRYQPELSLPPKLARLVRLRAVLVRCINQQLKQGK